LTEKKNTKNQIERIATWISDANMFIARMMRKNAALARENRQLKLLLQQQSPDTILGEINQESERRKRLNELRERFVPLAEEISWGTEVRDELDEDTELDQKWLEETERLKQMSFSEVQEEFDSEEEDDRRL